MKKDNVSIVIGRLKKDMGSPKGFGESPSEEGEEEETGLSACSGDIIRAIKEENAGALAKALQHFLEVASVEEESESYED